MNPGRCWVTLVVTMVRMLWRLRSFSSGDMSNELDGEKNVWITIFEFSIFNDKIVTSEQQDTSVMSLLATLHSPKYTIDKLNVWTLEMKIVVSVSKVKNIVCQGGNIIQNYLLRHPFLTAFPTVCCQFVTWQFPWYHTLKIVDAGMIMVVMTLAVFAILWYDCNPQW